MPRVNQANLLQLRDPDEDLPVAREVRPSPPPRPNPDASGEAVPPLLTPGAVKGWVWSLALHAVLLILLACWVFSTQRPQVTLIDTALGAEALGDPFGVEGGTTIIMGGVAPPPTAPLERMLDPTTTLTPPSLDKTYLDSLPKLTRAANPNAAKDANDTRSGQGGGSGGEGFGLARFGSVDGTVTERIRGVVVKVGDPQFTLLWDTQADLDLHVIEPGGKEIFWVERGQPTPDGGEIDVDNLTGFGPENISWFQRNDDGTKGALSHGPPGEYQWYVRYYGGSKVAGQDVPTRWKVRVKHAGTLKIYEGTLRRQKVSKTYTLQVGEPTDPHPPETKPPATEPDPKP